VLFKGVIGGIGELQIIIQSLISSELLSLLSHFSRLEHCLRGCLVCRLLRINILEHDDILLNLPVPTSVRKIALAKHSEVILRRYSLALLPVDHLLHLNSVVLTPTA